MSKAIALAATVPQHLPLMEMARTIIVTGCALALILAGKPLPF